MYVSLSFSLSIYIYIYIYISISLSLSIHISIYLSLSLYIYLSLSVYIYIYIYIYIYCAFRLTQRIGGGWVTGLPARPFWVEDARSISRDQRLSDRAITRRQTVQIAYRLSPAGPICYLLARPCPIRETSIRKHFGVGAQADS